MFPRSQGTTMVCTDVEICIPHLPIRIPTNLSLEIEIHSLCVFVLVDRSSILGSCHSLDECQRLVDIIIALAVGIQSNSLLAQEKRVFKPGHQFPIQLTRL